MGWLRGCGVDSCAVIRRGVGEVCFDLEERKEGAGREEKDDGEKEAFGGGRRLLLFPIARPTALALLIRLPFWLERKPVIVPSLALSLALFRAAALSFSDARLHFF